MQDEGSQNVAPLRCGNGFTELVAGDVQKGEAPTLFWDRLEIRLDENLDSLIAVINLDANRCVAKVHLMASSVCSSNYGVWQRGLPTREQRQGPVVAEPLPQHSCSTAVMTEWCRVRRDSAA